MENKRRKLLAVLFLLFCLLGIAALYGQARQPAEGTGGHSFNRQKVTLIAKSTESAFWKSVFAGASAAGTEYNMELLCQGADNEEDYKSQNQMIDAAVADGADAILFSAIDYEENAAAIDRAAEAGVRIIVIDSDVNSDQVECRIGTDNYQAGCPAGEAALNSDASALNVGIVNFDATTENGQSREKGFRDTIFRDDRVTLIDSVNSNSTIAAAKEATLQMLEDHPEINVLTTFNEWTTLGVGYAIREAGAASRIPPGSLRQQRGLRGHAGDRRSRRPGGPEPLRHRLSGRGDRLPASERAEAPLPGDRYLHHAGDQRKHVYRRISAPPFLLR